MLLFLKSSYSPASPHLLSKFEFGIAAPNATNYSYRPSIRGKRIVFGTGHDNKINDGGTYVPGADWTIVELDPSTYSRGNPPSNSGVPDFPAAFLNWPTIASNSTPNPIPSEGIDVTVFGYSADFLGSTGLGHYNTCKLRKDAVCSTDSGQSHSNSKFKF